MRPERLRAVRCHVLDCRSPAAWLSSCATAGLAADADKIFGPPDPVTKAPYTSRCAIASRALSSSA